MLVAWKCTDAGTEVGVVVAMQHGTFGRGLCPEEVFSWCSGLHAELKDESLLHATQVQYLPGAHGRRCAVMQVLRGTLEEVSYTELRVAGALS